MCCILFSDVISDPHLFYCDRDDNELPRGEVSFQMMTFTKILYEKNSSKCRQLQSVKSQSWRNRNTPRMHSGKYKVKRYFSGNYREIRGEMIQHNSKSCIFLKPGVSFDTKSNKNKNKTV